jgi:uncharacterized protein (TIGR00369 family)
MTPVMTAQDVSALIDREFPQIHWGGRAFSLAAVDRGEAVVKLDAQERHLRPGGTVSGPTLFALADLSAYAVTLAHIGPVPLAVTTNLTINFLRKPPPGILLGRARLLKLGRRLAVVEVDIRPEGAADPVAHAVATYSIPDRRKVS